MKNEIYFRYNHFKNRLGERELMMEKIVQLHQVSNVFNGKEIISDLTMGVNKGEIYGFLGPNGAGKTTTMRMMTNLIRPTHGKIELFGEPISFDSLKRIGSSIGSPILYENL